jgi:hypothetical protein
MLANQLRLWFASFAYALICAVRRVALKHTQFARANCDTIRDTIRLKLIKIGGLVRVSVRRIKLAMASSVPHQREYSIAHAHRRGVLANQTAHSPHSPNDRRLREADDATRPKHSSKRRSGFNPRQNAPASQRPALTRCRVRNTG